MAAYDEIKGLIIGIAWLQSSQMRIDCSHLKYEQLEHTKPGCDTFEPKKTNYKCQNTDIATGQAMYKLVKAKGKQITGVWNEQIMRLQKTSNFI